MHWISYPSTTTDALLQDPTPNLLCLFETDPSLSLVKTLRPLLVESQKLQKSSMLIPSGLKKHLKVHKSYAKAIFSSFRMENPHTLPILSLYMTHSYFRGIA